jgi:hypothetical protein
VLRQYITDTKNTHTLYARKYFEVQSIEGFKIVFFKYKVYLPEGLREKAMEHYKKDKEALMKHFIWPSLEKDVADFRG